MSEGTSEADQTSYVNDTASVDDLGSSAIEHSPEYQRLLRVRDELDDRLQEVRARREVAEQARMKANARLAALEGEAAARRARLRFVIDDADATVQDRTREYHVIEEARSAARSARGALAEVEAQVARETPPLLAELEAASSLVNSIQTREAALLEELASTDTALRRLDFEQQAVRTRALQEQLAGLEPVVREAASTGPADLSKEYAAQAERHASAWKAWGIVLVLAIVAAIGGGVLLFVIEQTPTGAVDSETVVTVVRNLLIVGLLLYVVRLASLQFRVHRHLEEVGRNKAAALSTFNRIVGVAGEQEVRNAIATVLAQAVFSSEDTGFIDGSDNHITLVERVAAGLPRASSP